MVNSERGTVNDRRVDVWEVMSEEGRKARMGRKKKKKKKKKKKRVRERAMKWIVG